MRQSKKGPMMAFWADLSGWLGAVAVLAAYSTFSLGWIGNGRLFQGCNLAGSTALLINGYYHGVWPSVTLNFTWATISAIALVRLQRSKSAAASFPTGQVPVEPRSAPVRREVR